MFKMTSFLFSIFLLFTQGAFSYVGDELLGHGYEVHSVSYSNDGKLLASGSGDTSVIVWNTETKKPIFQINDHQRTVYAVAFSKLQKNMLATSSSDGHLILWDISNRKIIRTLVRGDTTSSGILSLDFSPYSNLLAVSYMGGELVLYNTKTHSYARRVLAHPYGFAMSVKFSPDGKQLVTTGGVDNSVRLFRTEDLAHIYTFTLNNNNPVWDASFSPDGKTIASVDSAGELSLWRVGITTPIINNRVSDYLALSVEYSADGKKIYVGTDAFNSEEGNLVKIIDAQTGDILNSFDAHKNRIRGMCLSPDGQSLATASWDESVKIWKL